MPERGHTKSSLEVVTPRTHTALRVTHQVWRNRSTRRPHETVGAVLKWALAVMIKEAATNAIEDTPSFKPRSRPLLQKQNRGPLRP